MLNLPVDEDHEEQPLVRQKQLGPGNSLKGNWDREITMGIYTIPYLNILCELNHRTLMALGSCNNPRPVIGCRRHRLPKRGSAH